MRRANRVTSGIAIVLWQWRKSGAWTITKIIYSPRCFTRRSKLARALRLWRRRKLKRLLLEIELRRSIASGKFSRRGELKEGKPRAMIRGGFLNWFLQPINSL